MDKILTMSAAYPIGKFIYKPELDSTHRAKYIRAIAALPAQLRKALDQVSGEGLGSRYRPGGWTVQQVVHHVADSHMNAYMRFKLALTENTPTIKPYEQDAWVNTPEVKSTPIEHSLLILDGLHARWEGILNNLKEEDWSRAIFHPEHKQEMTLAELLAHYAWHGEHHLAHIRMALEGEG